MPSSQNVRFTFSSTADIAFEVVSFELSEGISELFCLNVELISESANADFATLLDKPATLTLFQGGLPVRYVHGLISQFEQGKTGFRRTWYRARIEPELARANLQSDWRIFQQRSVPQILKQLFKDRHWGACTQRLTEPHQTREFCVQAGELDLAFYQRLAAEEGLLSIFQHSEAGHSLILADHIATFGILQDEPLVYAPNPGGVPAQPSLHSFTYREQVRSSEQTQRDTPSLTRVTTWNNKNRRCIWTINPAAMNAMTTPVVNKHDNAGKPFTRTRLLALRSDAAHG